MTDVQVLRFIRRARDLGFPVEKIEELLALWQDRSRQSADVKRIALEQIAGLETRIREMQAMMDTLRHLADACCGDHRPDCPILADLLEGPQQVDAHSEGGRSAANRSGPATILQTH